MKSGKEKNRRIFFVNRSKIVKGDSDVKKDVRSSWETWAEKFVKSGFRDREKGGNFDELYDFRERNRKVLENGRNCDDRSNLC